MKIDLKEILAKHCNISTDTLGKVLRISDKPSVFLAAMKEACELIVDECIKRADVMRYRDNSEDLEPIIIDGKVVVHKFIYNDSPNK